MTSFLVSLMVTLTFFVLAALVGFRLARSPKPYPLTWLAGHIALFFLIAVGIGTSMGKIEAAKAETSIAMMALTFAGPPLIVCLVSGIVMICIKKRNRGWIFVHKLGVYGLALALVSSGIFMALRW